MRTAAVCLGDGSSNPASGLGQRSPTRAIWSPGGHFGLSQLREAGCPWHVVDGDRGAANISMHRPASHRELLARGARTTEAGKS